MIISYPENSNTTIVNYHRVREGPNWIMVYYKNAATVCLSVKEVRACFGVAKFTDGVKKICTWVQEQMDQYDGVGSEMEGRADTSFASDALSESDPNYQTRTVV